MTVHSIIIDGSAPPGVLQKFEMGENDVLVFTPGEVLAADFRGAIEAKLSRSPEAVSRMTALKMRMDSLATSDSCKSEVFEQFRALETYLDTALLHRSDRAVEYAMRYCYGICTAFVKEFVGDAAVVPGSAILIAEGSSIDLAASIVSVREHICGKSIVPAGQYVASDGYVRSIGSSVGQLFASVIGTALKAKLIAIHTEEFIEFKEDRMNYGDAMALCSAGHLGLYPSALALAVENSIPIDLIGDNRSVRIDNSPAPDRKWAGVSREDNLTLLTVTGYSLQGNVGISSAIFSSLAERGINIRFIAQPSSEFSISFAVRSADADKAAAAVESVTAGLWFGLATVLRLEVSIVTVIGVNMVHRKGISGEIFSVLGDAGINVVSYAQGGDEKSISIVVESSAAPEAVNLLRR